MQADRLVPRPGVELQVIVTTPNIVRNPLWFQIGG